MTKILIDPIYTQDPSKCASTYKFKEAVVQLLANREDVFFYWLVPDWIPEADWEWLPKSNRIEYIQIPAFKDRHKEYHYVREEWNRALMFRGEHWDIDMVLTNRVPLIPLMRLQMYRPGHRTMEWSRKIIAFEDMPVMSFKTSVPIPHESTQDMQTIAGYLAADATAICAYWEKAEILKIARNHVSPVRLRHLMNTIHESTPVRVLDVFPKTQEFILGKDRPFTIGFAGRMVKGHNFDDIFDVMEKHWIYRAGNDRKVECTISTVSTSTGRVDVPKWIDLKRLGREDFWDFMKNRVDVGIFMSPEEDYSMSLIEPLILGTPYVVYRCPWAVASLGPDYPFFIKNAKEAYALIREFYNNYPAQYQKFRAWQEGVFKPLLRERNKVNHHEVIDSVIREYEGQLAQFKKKVETPKEVVQKLLDYGEKNGGKIHLKTALMALQSSGELGHLGSKLDVAFQERISLSFSTDFNEFRLALLCNGYRDSSVTPGDMVKK